MTSSHPASCTTSTSLPRIDTDRVLDASMTSSSFILRFDIVFAIALLISHALVYAQQIGSFQTVIYLNGAPVSPSQVSCSGEAGYCCSSGQACAWDDAGQPACCAHGITCGGSVAGYYQQPAAVVDTTTVYQQNGCNCEPTTNVNVVPAAVPLTSTTTYYPPATTTPVYYTTTPVVAAAAGDGCNGRYTTITEVNVGQPTRQVGCTIIINGAWSIKSREIARTAGLVSIISILGLLLVEALCYT